MIYVVGSGPSGVSISNSLIKQGLEVTIIDVGIKINHINPENNSNKYNRKLVYGSAFAYKEFGIKEFSASYALGGLSNVWGASIYPFSNDEIKDWPINIEDLVSSYKHSSELFSIAANTEKKISFDKFSSKNIVNIKPSKQSTLVLNKIVNNSEILNKNGIKVDVSTLAFNLPSNKVNQCTLCGKCLEGCPDELIYNSNKTLESLKKNKNFSYIDNLEVTSLIESEKGVTILTKNHISKKQIEIHASRVYLATGVLSTAKILKNSFKKDIDQISIKASQYFIFPGFLFGNLDKSNNIDHSMSQLFMKITGPFLDAGDAHIQMYSMTDSLINQMSSKIKFLPNFLVNFLGKLMDRVVIFQGYLHSNEVNSRELQFVKSNPNQDDDLKIDNPNYDPLVRKKVRKILQKLNKHKTKVGFLVIPFLFSIGKFGYGFHVGGTFPMSKKPHGRQSDIYGRPYGLKKIHIVDSSVFPSIPASTITYTVMANAYRIGEHYDKYNVDN